VFRERQVSRLAHHFGPLRGSLFVPEAIVAASVCPNIYLELSSLMPHHLADVLAHVPSCRLMVGSDLPESLETEMSKIMTLETTREVSRHSVGLGGLDCLRKRVGLRSNCLRAFSFVDAS